MRYAGLPGTVNCFVLAADGATGANPSSGPWQEYDVEIVGDRPDNLEIGVFVNSWGNSHPGQRSSQYMYEGFNEEFHTYGCEWTPEHVTWEVDGHVYYEAKKEGSNIRYSTYDIYEPWELIDESTGDYDWISIWAEDSLRCAFDVWECNIPEWCGNWIASNNGSPIIFSWFRHYIYTPENGDDGSDFTLEFSEDYNGPEWDEEAWEPYGCELMDGFAVGGLGGSFTGDLPEDPGDVPDAVTSGLKSAKRNARLAYKSGVAKFSTSTAGRVNLSLFDLTGRLIQTFENSNKDAGEHSVSVDLRSIPAGSYMLSLKTQLFCENTRILTVSK
jgi:hypothetical protein